LPYETEEKIPTAKLLSRQEDHVIVQTPSGTQRWSLNGLQGNLAVQYMREFCHESGLAQYQNEIFRGRVVWDRHSQQDFVPDPLLSPLSWLWFPSKTTTAQYFHLTATLENLCDDWVKDENYDVQIVSRSQWVEKKKNEIKLGSVTFPIRAKVTPLNILEKLVRKNQDVMGTFWNEFAVGKKLRQHFSISFSSPVCRHTEFCGCRLNVQGISVVTMGFEWTGPELTITEQFRDLLILFSEKYG